MSQINATNMSKAAVMVMALVFAGCSSVDSPFDAKGVLPADGAIHINTALVDVPASRTGQNNDQLVPFGLFITNAASADNSYSNVCLKQVSGGWESYTGADAAAAKKVMYWQNATQPVTVTAYSPYASAATATGTLSGTVQANQTVEGADKASDLLYASAQVTPSASATSATGSRIVYDGTTKALNVNFAHQLSKVRVNVDLNTAELSGYITNVSRISLDQVNTAWQLSMDKGTVSEAATAVTGVVDMKKEATSATGYGYTFEAIIVPQNVVIPINIVTDKDSYVYLAASQAYQSGKLYTFNLKVMKDVVTLVGKVTVDDWTAGTASDGATSEQLIYNQQLINILSSEKYKVPKGSDGYIHPEDPQVMRKLNEITSIGVNNKNITSLEGIQYLKNLKDLYCANNQLTSLDVSKNTALETLFCANNQLTSLDVSNNTALTFLDCSGNQLTSLDVSKNTALETLICSTNQLTSLDVSKNTALQSLTCAGNQLTSLDVSKNTALTELYCDKNQLASLDVSKNTALKTLVCYNNKLTSLDSIQYLNNLNTFYCAGNQLTSLDVSKNTALKTLNCYNNKLTSLDVSKNTALETLVCGNNQLTSLDVSKNTALETLSCYNNKLTSLDVSKNTALTELNCQSNRLSALDITHNQLLTSIGCNNQSKSDGDSQTLTLTLTTEQETKLADGVNVYGITLKVVNATPIMKLKSIRK